MSTLPCRHFLELLLGVVHLVDHSIRVRIEVREAALCVGRSTGVADLFRHVRLVRHWRGVSGTSEGRSRGVRSAVAAGSRGGRHCKERRRPRGQLPDESATLIHVSACSSLAGVGKPWRPVALLVPSCFVAQAVELECRAPRPR